tara:strand:- start:728 stop:1153 length:426 start_codon:yes stop_codon:yes gene_type:complete
MIKYQLKCKKCKNIFDSWFSSSKEFEKLKKLKLINCESCKSLQIEKSIMSPRISSKLIKNDEANLSKIREVKTKIKDFQRFIKKNFDYVGENFSYEARSIHYGKKKYKKGIYGKASAEEIHDLNNEGIETAQIPWVKDNEN